MDRPQDWHSLHGRRAFVVGGSGGIGAALSLALASRGAELLVHGGHSAPALDALLEKARCAGSPRAEGLILPLDRPAPLLDRIEDLGKIDILAVAFGPFVQAALHETGAADWERLALLDLALPGALASALLPGMRGRGWGRFLFFGGTRTDTIRSCATNAAYAAAKTGLGVLVKSIASEYAADGVGAYLLCPGFIETEYLDDGLRSRLAAKSPGGRLLQPDQLGEFGAELLAADPPLASGAIIPVDGGLRL